MDCGDTWRKHRKLLHLYLGKKNANNYRQVMIEETVKYLRALLSKPGAFLDANRRWGLQVRFIIRYLIPK